KVVVRIADAGRRELLETRLVARRQSLRQPGGDCDGRCPNGQGDGARDGQLEGDAHQNGPQPWLGGPVMVMVAEPASKLPVPLVSWIVKGPELTKVPDAEPDVVESTL